MFAALMVGRLRETCAAANLLSAPRWQAPDALRSTELPLAKAAEKVLASMHVVLKKTMETRRKELQSMDDEKELNTGLGEEAEKHRELERHLRLTKAAEVRVVRNWRDLVDPSESDEFSAMEMRVDGSMESEGNADDAGLGEGEGAA